MSDLISREDLKKALNFVYNCDYIGSTSKEGIASDIIEYIDNAQAVKEYARQKGDWIDEGQYAEGHSEHYYRCSECGGHIIALRVDDFCKHCGADMRKGAMKNEGSN